MELSRSRVRLLRRIATRKGREAEGIVLLEGPRLIETALLHGADLLFVLTATGGALQGALQVDLLSRIESRGIEVIEIPPEQLEEFAQTETPQGILALAREPRHILPPPEAARGEHVLVLDRIQDPGNVGTLVRAAAALGVARVILLDGTADPWSAKALRASTGSAFHLPLHRIGWDEAWKWMSEARLPLLVAHGPGEDVRGRIGRTGDEDCWALLVGNEGEGPRQAALDNAAGLVAIPLREGVESLNAAMAGAILLWALGPGRARNA